MLGKYIRVKVTNPIHSINIQKQYEYPLNYGFIEGAKHFENNNIAGAFIMGIFHPVRTFDGRVIAIIRNLSEDKSVFIVAPKSMKFIVTQIRDALGLEDSVFIECLYEKSCGAVVCGKIYGELRFLLIKNKRSAHWGFPKGHVERGESPEETAAREVFEETGIQIDIIPEFASKAEYTIQGKVEKSVTIFLARTQNTNTVIQKEEIEDYIWLSYDKAIEILKFENDKSILKKAYGFIEANNTFC